LGAQHQQSPAFKALEGVQFVSPFLCLPERQRGLATWFAEGFALGVARGFSSVQRTISECARWVNFGAFQVD
jgi:hypothetical protein